MKRATGINLEEDELVVLDELAGELGISRSELIRRGIEEFLDTIDRHPNAPVHGPRLVTVSVEGLGRKPWAFRVAACSEADRDFMRFTLPNGGTRIISKHRIRYMDLMVVVEEAPSRPNKVRTKKESEGAK